MPTTENVPIGTIDFYTDFTDEGPSFHQSGTTEIPDYDDDEVKALDSEIIIDNSRIDYPETTENPNIATETFINDAQPVGITDIPNGFTDEDTALDTESENTTDMFSEVDILDSELVIDDSQLTSQIVHDKNPLVADELLPVSNKQQTTSVWNEKSKNTKPLKTNSEDYTTDIPFQETTDFYMNGNYEENDITTQSVEKADSSEENQQQVVDSEYIPQDVRTTQATTEQTIQPQTSEKLTQTQHPQTHSTTLNITQTPTTIPKYYKITTPVLSCSNQTCAMNTNDIVIQVREVIDKHSSQNTPSSSNSNKSLYYILKTKPVTNNTNSSCNKTVKPPCDDSYSRNIPRLEIIAERPIDVHFSICPQKCGKDHTHNYANNRAVFLRWFANKSDQTMGFETSNKIKTGGDVDC